MPNSPTLKAYTDATIFTGDTFVEEHALLARGDAIVDIVSNHKVPSEADRMSFGGQILTSGLIDVQVNGGGGILLNNEPTAQACLHVLQAHRKKGTTHILPTCISDTSLTADKLLKAMRTAREADSGVLGIHFEGPHLNKDARGVHKAEHVRALAPSELASYAPEGDEVMVVTLAPETCTAPDIQALHARGVVISLGHTQATPEKIRAALDAGATGFTHLFNGMGGLQARSPGPAGIALDDRLSWCSLIADGFHVSPEMIRLAVRAKPAGKVFLISDAMAPSGEDEAKSFLLYGETIAVSDGRCVTKEGKLAGSAITLIDAVRYCVRDVGLELEEALKMASVYPAAFLGLQSKIGKLLPGFHSGILALNPSLNNYSVLT